LDPSTRNPAVLRDGRVRCQFGRARRELVLWSCDFGPDGFEDELYEG